MKKFITLSCLILSTIVLFSFKAHKKDKLALAGIWVTIKPSPSSTRAGMKIFEENGNYYNVAFEHGATIITHKGKYKILNESTYRERVTDVRFNAKWDLKNKVFVNSYELSKDKTMLILNGMVYSKDHTDSLKWTEKYRKVQIP